MSLASLGFDAALWARSDMTQEAKMHTNVILGLSRIVAFDPFSPSNSLNDMPESEQGLRQRFGISRDEAALMLGKYLELYAGCRDPFEAAEEAARLVQDNASAA